MRRRLTRLSKRDYELISGTKELIAPSVQAANFAIPTNLQRQINTVRHRRLSTNACLVVHVLLLLHSSIGSTVGAFIAYLKAPDARYKKKTAAISQSIHHIALHTVLVSSVSASSPARPAHFELHARP